MMPIVMIVVNSCQIVSTGGTTATAAATTSCTTTTAIIMWSTHGVTSLNRAILLILDLPFLSQIHVSLFVLGQ